MVSMLRSTLLMLAIVLFVGTTSLGAVAEPPLNRVLPYDPVELVAGREVDGRPDLSIERDGYTYRFASEANRAAFEREPSRFEVADGGACGSMGPLSGLGDARRFVVHEGRIYFFASEQCRDTFLRDPARCIERPDPPIEGSAEARAQGAAVLDRCVQWSGGVRQIQALRGYRQSHETTTKREDGETKSSNTISIEFPYEPLVRRSDEPAPGPIDSLLRARFLDRSTQDQWWWGTLLSPEWSGMLSEGRAEPLAAARRAAFERQLLRLPIVLLRARFETGFIAVADGAGVTQDGPIDFVLVHYRGVTTRLGIHKESGQLIQVSFRGRDGTRFVGDVVRTYKGFITQNGITLPTSWQTSFNGEANPAISVRFLRIELNPRFEPGTFQPPAAAPAEAKTPVTPPAR